MDDDDDEDEDEEDEEEVRQPPEPGGEPLRFSELELLSELWLVM